MHAYDERASLRRDAVVLASWPVASGGEDPAAGAGELACASKPGHDRAHVGHGHVTTDTDNPPAFIAVIKLREAEDGNPSTYAGVETAALQKRGYPDLAPLSLALAPEKAFPIALATAKKMSWTIVEADPTTRRIEASERSFWMGFTDDIVVRVAAADSGSRIDVRSASRHGRSDLGVNAARIRTYLAALSEAEKPGN